MHRTSMPARASLSLAVAFGLAALSQPALAQNSCPKATIEGPASLTLVDVTPSGSGFGPTTYTLDASGSTIGTTATYRWTQTGNPAATLHNANSRVATLVAPDVGAAGGRIEVTLTVTSCGRTDTAKVRFNIVDGDPVTPAPNSPPDAVGSANPAEALEGARVELQGGLSSDPDPDTTLIHRWTQLRGAPVTLNDANTKTAWFTAPEVTSSQTLEFQLEVSDGELSSTTTVPVTVVWTNRPPVARASCPLRIDEGGLVTLDGRGSTDRDDGIVAYRWQQTVGLPTVPAAGVIDWNRDVVTFTAPQLGYQQVGEMPFRLTVTDAAGLESVSDCAVIVRDVTAPAIAAPSDIVAEATSAAGRAVDYTVTASDGVDGPFPPVNSHDFFTCAPAPGSVFALDRTSPVQCSATDSAGNTATAGFTVQVLDRTAPQVTVPLSFALEATAPFGAVARFDATSFDLVDGAGAAECIPASGSSFPVGTTVVSCDAVDTRRNRSAARTFDVVVHDTTPPAFAGLGGDLELEAGSPAGAIVSYALPTATDLVDGDVAVGCTPASGTVLALGTHAVACSARDSRGNEARAGFSVKVRDTVAPVIAPHGGETAEATGPNGALVFYPLPAATDAVSPHVTASCTPASATVFGLGTTTVTCSAKDDAGNPATPTTFGVTVRDTTAPALTLVRDVDAEATSANGASVVFALPTASDAVDGAPDVTCDAASGSTFALGTTTVTCSATDRAGNVGLTSFHVTVRDRTAPELSGLVDLGVFATSASQAVVDYAQPTARDLVDGDVAVSCSPVSGSSFPVGRTSVACAATDAAGNTARGSFTVDVGYRFPGFLQPVDNLPSTNVAKAGSAIPVKFNLGGNHGMAIMEPGYPRVVTTSCSGATGTTIEETVTAGGSSLQFDATTGQYIYVWKTDRAWTGCRTLEVKLKNTPVQKAAFNFR